MGSLANDTECSANVRDMACSANGTVIRSVPLTFIYEVLQTLVTWAVLQTLYGSYGLSCKRYRHVRCFTNDCDPHSASTGHWAVLQTLPGHARCSANVRSSVVALQTFSNGMLVVLQTFGKLLQGTINVTQDLEGFCKRL